MGTAASLHVIASFLPLSTLSIFSLNYLSPYLSLSTLSFGVFRVLPPVAIHVFSSEL